MHTRALLQHVAPWLVAGVAGVIAPTAGAVPVQVLDTFNFIDNREASPLGPAGVFLNVGADVMPVAGTTVTARQGGTTKAIPYLNSPADPYQFISNKFAYDPALTGAWNLTITNASAPNSPQSVTTRPICPTLCGGANSATNPFLTPFVTDVYADSLSTTPHLTWTVPAYVAPPDTTMSVRVLIDARNANGTYSLISSVGLPSTATSYTVPSSLLVAGRDYVFSVQTTLANAADGSQVETSRAFFSFSPSAQPTSFTGPVALPVVDPNGQFSFNLAVRAGAPVLLDPAVATGYDFQTGVGDPLFASVTLPDLGAFVYDLDLWNGSQWVFDTVLAPLATFTFAGGGVDRFRIEGIPASSMLDPADVTAFETEVTFAGDGRFTGTMTPLVANAVPEPAMLGLLAFGIGGSGIGWRRPGGRRRASRLLRSPIDPDGLQWKPARRLPWRRIVAAGFLAIATAARADGVAPLDGAWTVSGRLTSQVDIADGRGTWRFIVNGGGRNPCNGRAFPLVVTAVDEGFQVDVDGESVMRGCGTFHLKVELSDSQSGVGRFEDGRTVQFARR